MKYLAFISLFFCFYFGFSQSQKINIKAKLNADDDTMAIIEEIIFYNHSKDSLKNIYLHNWANSYKDPTTPLSKRLLDDYDRSLYFSNKKDRGYSKIYSIINKHSLANFTIDESTPDIIKVSLNETLKPKDSIAIIATYQVKIPNAKFTKYGKSKNGYHLRFWHLTPAVYDTKWHLQSNYNMDDLYMLPTDYKVEFTIPKSFDLVSELYKKTIVNKNEKTYHLNGKKRVDLEIDIINANEFKSYKFKGLEVISNLNTKDLNYNISKSLINREVNFIKKYLGKYPHSKLLLNKIAYKKNPVYGLNQLPKFLNPFQENFEFDIKTFKILTKKFIDNTIITDTRKDYWLNDSLQTFLMLKYVEKYYPEIKAIGNISKIWGIKSYHLSEIKFNEKYPFVYQFAMRKNLDQPLKTRTDSLSTFNRKIVNKYKAGIGLNYLDNYLEKGTLKKALNKFYKNKKLTKTNTNAFKKELLNHTKKELNWFFNDYLKTKKRIDYTIKKITKTKDSVYVKIKNKTHFSAPMTIYGVQNKKVIYKKWLTNIDTTKTISLPKLDYKRITLNYNYLIPEFNLRDNWKRFNNSLLNRPLKLRFIKDIDDPYYNQVFYNFIYDYNYYDGLILGLSFSNKTLFKKKWSYKIAPAYGLKSSQITGVFSFKFQNYYPNSELLNQFYFGSVFSTFHYAPN
ncbi:MAG TPA: aminopeptidase, partial [Flavobacteriia bacterium]|nr:aminopeptidase [Flavobacteriia bacterium]